MRKRTKSLLALLLAVVMILSSAGASLAAPEDEYGTGTEGPGEAADPEEGPEESSDGQEELSDPESVELEMEDVDPSSLSIKKLGELPDDEEGEEEEVGEISLTPDTSLNQTVRVSVFLETPGALNAGYAPQGVGTNSGAIAYRDSLRANQTQMTAQIESAIGYSMDVKWNLTLLVNAISGYVKVKDIPIIERMSGVAAVVRETQYEVPREASGSQPNTATTSRDMVGATSAWSAGYTGTGTRIAIIDTGIDTTHQSFNADAFNYSINQQGKSGSLMTASDVSRVRNQLNSGNSKANDDITVKETVYVLADELVSGENYLIVNRNTAGSGYALGRSNMSAVSDAVTVNEGISETDGKVYISGTDVDETSVWTVDGNSGSFTLKNGQYYLSSGNGFGFSSSLVFSTMPKTWKAGTDTLYYMNGSCSGYYVAFAGCSWTLCNRCSSVYFFKEETITHDFDPYSISSIEVTPASIDLYKGNTVRLMLEVGPYTAKNQPVVWTSSDTAVASVDESGMVTATGTGTAIITAASAKDSSVSAACEVNVISANKTMNGIIWDEEGREFFTTFNTDTLPAWSRNHADGYMLNLTAAFMESPNTLYAATLYYFTGETILYRVNRSSYELEEYGQNFAWALDMAIGASDPDYADYAGMVYTCGTYLVAGPIEPSDDGAGNVFCGLPYALLDCSDVTGDAFLVGIACKERTRSGGTYYVLDEFGVIWQTTLRFSNDQEEGFCFSTPVKILDTGIYTDFLFQNLYYDGTYLYWTHTDEDYAYLYIIDLETDKIYNAGDFGVDVWPLTGMYVDGSVAPASAGGVMDDGSPANADLSGLRVAASRDALMTPQVQARLKAEAAKYAGKAKPSAEHTGEQVTGNEPVEPEEPEEPEAPAEPETPADETGEPVEVPGDEPSEGSSEGPGEENEPGDAGEEIPGGTGEGSEASEEDVPPVESGEPGGAEDEAPGDEEEPEPDDPAYTGSVNAAVSTSKVKRPARNKASVTDAESGEDNTVEVRICETYDSHNGLYVISYDPAVLEYAGIKSGTASWSAHALAEAGTVTFAFADTVPAAAGQDIAVASFRRLTDSKTALTVVTKERGSRVALDEKEDITISGTELPKPAFKTQSLYLSGQIGVNFYLELPVIAGVDYSDSYMTFTVPHGTCTARADFDPNRKNRAGTYYGFTCYVNSVQMMEPITATFHYTEGDQEKTVTNTYAVNDYFNAFDKLVNEGLVTDPTTIALVRALADYGHYVQPFLAASRHWTLGADYAALEKHYTESFDTESISAPAFLKTNNTDGDITDITYSLTLDSSTAINVYFKPGSGYDGPFTASVDGGAAAQYMPGSDGRYCVRISGIPAHELSKQHTITVSTADGHTAEVTVSALCYVNAVLKNYSGTDEYDVMARNAAAALYAYSQAAGLYKTAHPNE